MAHSRSRNNTTMIAKDMRDALEENQRLREKLVEARREAVNNEAIAERMRQRWQEAETKIRKLAHPTPVPAPNIINFEEACRQMGTFAEDFARLRDRCLKICKERDQCREIVYTWKEYLHAQPCDRARLFTLAAKLTEAIQ